MIIINNSQHHCRPDSSFNKENEYLLNFIYKCNQCLTWSEHEFFVKGKNNYLGNQAVKYMNIKV